MKTGNELPQAFTPQSFAHPPMTPAKQHQDGKSYTKETTSFLGHLFLRVQREFSGIETANRSGA